ncbi:MAG: replication initiation protein [Spiroplasma ixodetis]|nr:replication initiation protein [Spiroplasma ixodetis]
MEQDLKKDKKKNRYDGVTIQYANELARNYSKFSLEEQKALHLIFSHINPFEKNPTTFEINKSEFFEKLNLVGDSKYERYKRTIEKIIQKSFVEIKDKMTGNKINGVAITASIWNDKKTFFEVDINPRFMPYLEQFIGYYTKIDLDSLVSFKSKHALTLYKLFCSWNDKKQTQIGTKDLKDLLGISKEAYVQNGKFNRSEFENKTIKKAISEINQSGNLTVNWKKVKKANKVLYYHFDWNFRNKNKDIIDDHKQNIYQISNTEINNKDKINIKMSEGEIKKILEKLDNY